MFKVGDIVKVKEDAKSIPDGVNFVREMDCYRGNTYEIKDTNIGGRKNTYHLIGCDYVYGEWVFDESWLEPVYSDDIDVNENDIEGLLCLK